MPTVDPIPNITISSNTPGTTAQAAILVNAVQPVSTVTGSVAVEFNGETVSTPLTVVFDEVVKPTASVSIVDPRLSVEVGTAVLLSNSNWRIPLTITVV